MELKVFSEYAQDIEKENSNTGKEKLVSEMLSKSDPQSIGIVARFIQGRKFPLKINKNLSFSTSLMRSAISEATGISEDEVKEKSAETSNMGELFDIYDITSSSGQQTLGNNKLMLTEVYDKFEKISSESGSGSQQRKVDLVVSLLSRCSPIEAEYLTRIILGKLSIGIGEGTVRKSISRAYSIDEDKVERAIMLSSDVGYVAQVASQEGLNGLENISMNVCEVPIRSMNATKSTVSEAFEDIDRDYIYGEYKYDGFRIQIHKDRDNVKLYTRKLEDVTSSLPDVVKYVKQNIDAETVIIDGEIVGYESDNLETPLSYQETQQRLRRKYDIDEMVEEIPVRPKIFDILYHSEYGELLDTNLSGRVQILESTCANKMLGERRECYNERDLESLMSDADEVGHEGGMAKDPTSIYEPNSRGKNWLKLKPEGETIDAVVIGGTYGDGRRSDFIASYKLGIWDDGKLKHIGDVGTGFTDEEFKKYTNMLEKEIISQDGSDLDINPSVVFEVKFEEVQESTKYESGYGLRFPKFIRHRDTKSVDDADTVERLQNIAEILN